MDFVILESPFATNTLDLGNGILYVAKREENIAYARACMHDCLVNHNEAPFASHLLYTQEGVLDDDIPEQRKLGIEAGLELGRQAKSRAFYIDRGFSSGMKWALKFALELNQPCEVRRLQGEWNLGWEPSLTLEDLVEMVRD